MKLYWMSHNDINWHGPINCNHINCKEQFIYCYEQPLGRKLIASFDTTKTTIKIIKENNEKK